MAIVTGRAWPSTVVHRRSFSGPALTVAYSWFPGGGDDGDGAVDPGGGAEPLAPFGVAVGAVDEVAGVEGEGGPGGLAEGFAEDARPVGFHVVLGVAEIDEGEGGGLGFGGAEVEPLGPVGAVAHAVGVKGVGREVSEGDGVGVGFAEVGFKVGRRGGVGGWRRWRGRCRWRGRARRGRGGQRYRCAK